MQIAIITGEVSGDRAGGQLAKEIRRLSPNAQIWGTGGKYLREAGADVLVDSSGWGIVGVVSAARLLPRILAARARLQAEFLRRKPDIFIPIDAGAINLGFPGIEGFCPWVRRHLPQTKILYYFPPGSWRRTLKKSTLAENADVIATPFPWSETELRRLGANAHFVGHPLLDLVAPETAPARFAERVGLSNDRPVVGILPGSRSTEIEQVLPLQLAAAQIIHQRVPGVQFLVALAPTVDRDVVVRYLNRIKYQKPRRPEESESGRSGRTIAVPVTDSGQAVSPDELMRRQKEWRERHSEMPASANPGELALAIVEDATYDAMAVSDILLICSGTATLEAAILGRPMVITYKMSEWNRPQYLLVKKSLPPFIGMPNLLADKKIVPEFVQEAATPEALANEAIGLLLEPERMLRMREDLQKTIALLGEKGGAARTAQMVVDLAEKTSQSGIQ